MIILEGTDAVGKTTTKKLLENLYNIDCSDRSLNTITKYMEFNISMEDRARIYQEYLQTHDDVVVIMINNDGDELLRRVYSRETISDYDLLAPIYNKLYHDTFLYMEKNNMLEDKMVLVDTTNLTIEEQVRAVYEAVHKEQNKKLVSRRLYDNSNK